MGRHLVDGVMGVRFRVGGGGRGNDTWRLRQKFVFTLGLT